MWVVVDSEVVDVSERAVDMSENMEGGRVLVVRMSG
jgi:hypothetical protein